MNSIRRWIIASSASSVLLGVSSALAQESDCVPMLNGNFELGLEGWLVEPTATQSGNASSFAEAGIVDGSVYSKLMSGQALMAQTIASAVGLADKAEGASLATAAITIRAPEFTVAHRYLTFAVGGGFEVISFGSAHSTLNARIAVTPIAQKELSHQLGNVALPPFPNCEWGISVLGTFLQEQPVAIDLLVQNGQSTGIQIGDTVDMSMVLECASFAANSCDDGTVFGGLVLDNVQLCAFPPGVVPGDITGDGLVNVDDLLTVINAWGLCGTPPSACAADLNGDLVVDVDDLLIVINHWD